MTFEDNIQQTKALFNIVKKCVENKSDLKTLNCIEGDFIIYHGVYAKLRPYRFLLHFFKSIIFSEDYNIMLENQEIEYFDEKKYNIASVITADHLYNDNLKPLVDRLTEKGVQKNLLHVKKKWTLRLFPTSSKFSLSIIRMLLTKKIKLKHVPSVAYIKYVQIPRCKRLLEVLRDFIDKKYLLILSAETCDVFSRVAAMVAREHDIEYLLFQCGPISEKTNLEISSIVADYFLAWPDSKDLLKKILPRSKVEIKYFTPPRFYSAEISDLKKKNDVAVFLPWLNFTSPSKSILEQIDLTLCALEDLGLCVCIKLHPSTDEALEKLILEKYGRFTFYRKDAPSMELIKDSETTINFGSTVSYDADNIGIKTAIINFDKRIEDDHPFLKLKNVMNVKKIDDLGKFFNAFKAMHISNNTDLGALDFVYSRLIVTDAKMDR